MINGLIPCSKYVPLHGALILSIIAQVILVFDQGSSWNSYLFIDWDLPESIAIYCDRAMALIACISLSLYYIKGKVAYLWPIVFWLISLPSILAFTQNHFAYEIVIFCHAIRFIVPLYLIFQQVLSSQIIIWGLAMTFIGHGIEAIMKHPEFADYIFHGWNSFLSSTLAPTQSLVHQILFAIGIVDIIVALALFTRFRKLGLAYMAVWGFLTAAIRLHFDPLLGPYKMLLRSPHWLIPIYMLLLEKKGPSSHLESFNDKNSQLSHTLS